MITFPSWSRRSRKFALLIGINYYDSNDILPLRGAVADAREMKAYLQEQLHFSQDRISTLENQSATRSAIIEALQRLANDPHIHRGDPIVIYYAGLGSEMTAPAGWETGSSNPNIQLILPYDVFCKSGDQVVPPIPGRTLDALVATIAQEKGDNIVVILDCGHSAPPTKASNDSSYLVRSVPFSSNFRFPKNLDQEIWSLSPNNGRFRSHVLLAACNSSGLAWESQGHGVFTAALLDLFKGTDISNLRYCDIPMRVDLNSWQSPYCEGLNRERYIFTSTSPSSVQLFIPAFTRATKDSPVTYILNGGTAHGLVVGDEFAIYPDMDCHESGEILVVDELGPFYSMMRPLNKRFPITGNSVALKVKEGKRRGLRLHCCPGNKVNEILSLLHDNDQDYSSIVIVDTPDDAQVDIFMKEDQTILRFRNMISSSLGFRIGPTAKELSRVLKASLRFISELDRTADFPQITAHVQVTIYELEPSHWQYPGVPIAELSPLNAVPDQNKPFILRQGSSYGFKLTNDSCYDLYPIVQYFDPNNEFKFDNLYEPACSRSILDVPLKNSGGSLTIGYGSGGLSPLVIPSSEGESLGFLKISLFTRPLDPFYQARSFRLTRVLPESFKGPWATIIYPVIHNQASAAQHRPPPDLQEIPNHVSCYLLGLNNNREYSVVLGESASSVSRLKFQSLVQLSFPLMLQNSKPEIPLQKTAWPKRLWRRIKILILRYCAAFRTPSHSSPKFSSTHVSSKMLILPP